MAWILKEEENIVECQNSFLDDWPAPMEQPFMKLQRQTYKIAKPDQTRETLINEENILRMNLHKTLLFFPPLSFLL